VPGRALPGFGRHPGNPAALIELDHVVLPDAAQAPCQASYQQVRQQPPGKTVGSLNLVSPDLGRLSYLIWDGRAA